MFNYPESLNPTHTEVFNLENTATQIPKCVIKFDEWKGVPIKETFGGKPVVSVGDKPMFAELAIMTLFQMGGWQSRWIETYGKGGMSPIYLSEWKDDKFKNQKADPIMDEKILKVLSDIAKLNGNSFSGCWDVIGWRDDRIIFAESKRMKKDKIRQTQVNWLSAGIKYGLKPDNFLIVQWDISNK